MTVGGGNIAGTLYYEYCNEFKGSVGLQFAFSLCFVILAPLLRERERENLRVFSPDVVVHCQGRQSSLPPSVTAEVELCDGEWGGRSGGGVWVD